MEERQSTINGRIMVVRSLGFGTYIQVEGLTQSGGVVYDVWRTTLGKIRRKNLKKKNCLILGLGGGSAALLVKKFWPEAKITGVDIDPVMVELGQKYLGLESLNVVIKDAHDFIKRTKEKFDLILIDTYIGYEYPKKFEKEEFLFLVKKSLSKEGLAVFNRLYSGEKRPLAIKFGEKLEKVFSKVDFVYPEANLMLLCYN